MTEKASYDLVQTADRDALIGAAFAFRQIDPCDAGRTGVWSPRLASCERRLSTPTAVNRRTGVWTPRFENNSKRCIEDVETPIHSRGCEEPPFTARRV